jgi:hypothetical protein
MCRDPPYLSFLFVRRVGKKNFLFFKRSNRNERNDLVELSAMKVDRLLLLVILLFLSSGSFVNAGPLGDFFKKVGHSISKPVQPPPQSPPPSTRSQPAKTPHPARRSSSRATPAAATASPADEKPSHPSKEADSAASVRTVSAAEIEKMKAGLPYGVPVPGRKGMVTSPYLPEEGKYIDVTDFPSGSMVKDPYTGKFFLVP